MALFDDEVVEALERALCWVGRSAENRDGLAIVAQQRVVNLIDGGSRT